MTSGKGFDGVDPLGLPVRVRSLTEEILDEPLELIEADPPT